MNDEIDIEPQEGEAIGDWLGRAFEALDPSDYPTALLGKDRPYNGQPHTDEGERGRTEVRGLTMRDVKDCIVVGAYEASGLSAEDYPPTIYGLPWNDMDVMAVLQQAMCQIEKRMGIFPNVPPLTYVNEPE